MKTCVLITGTNAVGKSTLAEELIGHYGGRATISKVLTELQDERVCFAGPYKIGNRYGGVDCFNCTSILASVVEQGLKEHDVIYCEGMYLHTFGTNLLRAIFKADKQLIVFLHAPAEVIRQRCYKRTGASGRGGTGTQFDKVFAKQRACAVSAKKWASIGVPVMCFDTSLVDMKEIVMQVAEKVEQLCYQQ